MPCQEYTRLAGLFESRRQAYAYIRFNERKVQVSKQHYEELVKAGYTAMTTAIKNMGRHEMNCSLCKSRSTQ